MQQPEAPTGPVLPYDLLTRIRAFLQEKGVQGYVVGGCVRDSLLGNACADVDLAVDAPALELAREFASLTGGAFVPLDEAHAIARVVYQAKQVLDFSSLKGSIDQDLSGRDFTIDAMAISLEDVHPGAGRAPVIDPWGGRRDLDEKRIRAVSDGVFAEDPARLLRGVRLAAEMRFSIDPNTEKVIKRDAHLVGRVAGERIREELVRLLLLPDGAATLFYLDKLGLLAVLLPELTAAKGVVQPAEHHWDVFEHSLRTVQAVEALIDRRDMGGEKRKVVGGRGGPKSHISLLTSQAVLAEAPWSETLAAHFGQTVGTTPRRVMIKLAALLHDVAKPQTRSVEPTGRVRFLGHGQEGAAVAVAVLERWRFSNRETKLVEAMVLHHLRPTQMAQGDELPSQHAIYRYFRDVDDAAIDTLFLNLGDHWASRGPELTLEGWQAHVKVIKYILSEHLNQGKSSRPHRLVDGYDIMAVYGIRPGPELGNVLEALKEAQATGEIATRDEALALAGKLIELARGNS